MRSGIPGLMGRTRYSLEISRNFQGSNNNNIIRLLSLSQIRSYAQGRTISNEKSNEKLKKLEEEEKKRASSIYRPISNENTFLQEIDATLGYDKGPSIEYLYVVPQVQWSMKYLKAGLYSTSNPYGHAAIRYRLPDGSEHIMNISGRPKSPMVNFLTPYEYLFGDPDKTRTLGSEQGGVFYRSIVGFRLENFPTDLLLKTHAYYQDLQKRERESKVGFNLLALPSWIRIPILQKAIERGNCALFTSNGLVAGDVIKNSTILPKYLFAKLYFKALNTWGWRGITGKRNKNGNDEDVVCRPINIIYYHQARPLGDYDFDELEGLDKSRHKNRDPSGWVSPWLFSKNNQKFRNLKLLAHAHVYLMPENNNNNNNNNNSNPSHYKGICKICKPWRPNWIGPTWDYD